MEDDKLNPLVQYGVGAVPYHIHNNTDSPFISSSNFSVGTGVTIGNSVPITITNTGVTSLVAGSGITISNSTGAVTVASNVGKFGGTGSDGVLSLASGTTTLSLNNARTFVKNYSSISITGTGKLAFSNPHTEGTFIILKSQGNVTLTSSTAPMVDASGMGGAAGGFGTGGASNTDSNGGGGGGGASSINDGGAGTPTGTTGATPGANGGNGSVGRGLGRNTAGQGGQAAGRTAYTATGGTSFGYDGTATTYVRTILFIPGSGGGGGGGSEHNGASPANGANGGAGGGALYIECGGTLNFTTASGISIAGINGSDGPSNVSFGGGGGGGGAGCGVILYTTATASNGTFILSGGTGGNQTTGNVAGNGGAGWYLIAPNTDIA